MKRTTMTSVPANPYEQSASMSRWRKFRLRIKLRALAKKVEKIFPFGKYGDDLHLLWTTFQFNEFLQAKLELFSREQVLSKSAPPEGYSDANPNPHLVAYLDYILTKYDGYTLSTSDAVVTNVDKFARTIVASMMPSVENPCGGDDIFFEIPYPGKDEHLQKEPTAVETVD